jgi:hypothetical protein
VRGRGTTAPLTCQGADVEEPVTVGMLGDADAFGFSVPVNNSN